MNLKEKVAQMVVVRASGYLFDNQIRYPVWEPPIHKLKYWLQDLGVGGVIFVDGSTVDLATRIQQLQSWAKIPLLLAADIEEGVGQRFAGATWFPPPMAIAAIAKTDLTKAQKYAETMGAITAQEAMAIGLNWVLAPVVDVNNNPDNPVINIRAFGETTELVGQLARAFIGGAQEYQVLTTAKHFPGHGDTGVDSHFDLPVIPHWENRLAEVELPPFREAIAAGVDSVMSAHLLIPSWDEELPATLSHKIITGQLRQNLGFDGLVVTDALVMGAIANGYGLAEASVLAVEAGADILLMPLDAEVTINAVCDAVTQGRISESRIDESLERIWQAKRKVYPTWQPGDEKISDYSSSPTYNLVEKLAQPKAQETVAQILQDSIQAAGGSLTPSKNNNHLRNLIVVQDLLNTPFLGNHTPAIAIPQKYGYQPHLIDNNSEALPNFTSHGSTLLQLFIRGNPFGKSASLTQLADDLVKKLLKNGELQGLIIYGSQYTLKQFSAELLSEIPYIFCYGQMPKAQAIALEILFPDFLSSL
ncbi:glycoside hydrolase family 3 N-terminal domain-containing protein [Okeania sp.]|uniref:glycoside hydrolase family 3 N-terminal domain-containing protein n=1 Tax=Okeania sp. TaxID=3100323 RepID=UPI002B4ABB3D|nr:glycoside hydrolase family 3 N-terminal domain-containing protein [Okeania sp.]MEB3339803.1 glycoside hydrolase family 3 N-terminal domain-containing protein [Okeania sp.]